MEQGEAHSLPSGETEINPYLLGETNPAPLGSGEAESILQPSGETEPAPLASGETETSPEPSGEAELSSEASGEAKPNSCHSNKGRNGTLIRSEVFNVRWLLVPPSGVPRY